MNVKKIHPKLILSIALALALVAVSYGIILAFYPTVISSKLHYNREMVPVKAFYGNSTLDPELDCAKVFPMDRQVPKTNDIARSTLEALINGPSFEEMQQGYFTSFSPSMKIRNFMVRGGVAYVDFNAALMADVDGTCQAVALRAEVTQTLLQFPHIKNVIITIEGRADGAFK